MQKLQHNAYLLAIMFFLVFNRSVSILSMKLKCYSSPIFASRAFLKVLHFCPTDSTHLAHKFSNSSRDEEIVGIEIFMRNSFSFFVSFTGKA